MSRTRWQDRALALVAVARQRQEEAGEQGMLVQQVSLPANARTIDAVLVAAAPDEVWGVLRGLMRGREVVIEHESEPPVPAKIYNALTKLCWRAELWELEGTLMERVPMLLVLSVGRPERALERLPFERQEFEGLYRGDWGELTVALVDVKRLEPGPGRWFLRLFNHDDEAFQHNMRHFLRDETMTRETRKKVADAILEQETEFPEGQRQATFDEIEALSWDRGIQKGLEQGIQKGLEQGIQKGLEQGMQKGLEQGMQKGLEQGIQKGLEQGMQKGLEQGMQKGRQTLLTIAQAMLPAEECEALDQIEDLEELQAELVRRLTRR